MVKGNWVNNGNGTIADLMAQSQGRFYGKEMKEYLRQKYSDNISKRLNPAKFLDFLKLCIQSDIERILTSKPKE
jgi:hypothetical protein